MSWTVMPTLSTAVTWTVGSAAGSVATRTTPRRIARTSRPRRIPLRMARHLRLRRRAHPEAIQQVVADAERVGGDGEGRVHRRARAEEAAVDDVEVVEIVRLAVDVERGRLGVVAEPDRAV